MSKFSEWSRWTWLEVELMMMSVMPDAVTNKVYSVKEITQLLTKPCLNVYQLRGQAQGGLLTMTFAGREHTMTSWKSIFFVEEPEEKQVGRVPVWRSDILAGFSSDITVVEATRYVIRRLPRHNAVVLPRFVNHTVNVRGDWQDVRERFRKTVRKNELRWIRKYGYQYDMSHDLEDLEVFYRQMYLPTMADRHDELSLPMPSGEARQYFRHGGLFRINRDGRWVSGVICHPVRKILIADILGVRDADEELVREGAISATYYAAIHWANEHGYDGVNFLGSSPYLGTGNFQHKRKWGATVSIPVDVQRRIWITVRRSVPAVSQFFVQNPLAIIGEDEKLYGLIVVDDPRRVSAEVREEWETRYSTPGLRSLLIRSPGNFAEAPANVNDPDLMIPISEATGS